MPITYTPTAVFTQLGTTAAIVMPDAPVAVTEPVMNLADAARAARALGYAFLDWDQRVWTTGTLANTGNIGVWVGGINAIALVDPVASPTLVRTYNLRVPTQVNVGATVLTGATWYYLYAYIDTGALAVEVSSTAPEQDYFHWKSGAPFTHRYLGAFRTDAAGVPFPFYALRGENRYAYDEIASTGANSLVPWGSFAGPAVTSQILTARIPPFTRPVRTIIRVEADNVSGAPQSFTVAKTVASFGGVIANPRYYGMAIAQFVSDEFTMEPDTTGSVDVAPTVAGVTVFLRVVGWIDPGFP